LITLLYFLTGSLGIIWDAERKKRLANKSSTNEFENAITCLEGKKYLLRLYVKGQTPNSKRAMENTEKICKERLNGRYEPELLGHSAL
jgi:hypothetical protein